MKISSESALKRKLTQTIRCRAYQWHFNWSIVCDLILIYPVIRGNRKYQFHKALKMNLSPSFGQMVSQQNLYNVSFSETNLENKEITNA